MTKKMKALFLENDSMSFAVKVDQGLVHIDWADRVSGKKIAQGPMVFAYTEKKEEAVSEHSALNVVSVEKKGDGSLKIRAANTCLEIEETIVMKKNPACLEESLWVRSLCGERLSLPDLVVGFTLPLTNQSGWIVPEILNDRWVAIPHRRDTIRYTSLDPEKKYQDYGALGLLTKRGFTLNAFQVSVSTVEFFGSEGWARDMAGRTLATVRYSQEQMVFSVLGIEYLKDGAYLRFGGTAMWHGDPEYLQNLEPHTEINLGTTTHILVNGGWKEGYYAFRDLMRQKGNGLPEKYNPPVHWNELYDNPLWNIGGAKNQDSPDMRVKYYTVKDMEKEAAKAKELGCEALYLDPGWDTNFASTIWDAKRLGPQKKFVALLKSKYGLQLSLHAPLAVWCNSSTYSRDADRLGENGKRIEGSLCSGATSYLKDKGQRLVKICKDGAAFLMYDGSAFTGPCFDKSHGHPVPYTKEAQCRNYLELCRRVHEKYPDTLIEMHDMVVGGTNLRYCPNYYLYGLPGSFDENWAYEYMWDPMEDILSGRAMSLYYYNLAYDLPMYIHINLTVDNVHCLEFWWYASTCRHLGVGGKHREPAVWEAHKDAMKTYLRMKELYVQGKFYGFGEDIHVHVLPEKRRVAVNLFNLTDKLVRKTLAIPVRKIGLVAGGSYVNKNGIAVSGETLYCNRLLEPYSAEVLELQPAD